MKKFIPALLIASVLLAGCTGPFQLTKNLHKWQTNVSEERWTEEVVFLGCVIIPVYELCTLADVLIFNSIEFWGGENPIQKASAPVGNEMCLRSVAEQM
jgi:hypothetical protein